MNFLENSTIYASEIKVSHNGDITFFDARIEFGKGNVDESILKGAPSANLLKGEEKMKNLLTYGSEHSPEDTEPLSDFEDTEHSPEDTEPLSDFEDTESLSESSLEEVELVRSKNHKTKFLESSEHSEDFDPMEIVEF